MNYSLNCLAGISETMKSPLNRNAVIYIGSSNTFKARNIIKHADPNSVASTIGDVSSFSGIPYLLSQPNALQARVHAKAIVVEFFFNDFWSVFDKTLSYCEYEQRISNALQALLPFPGDVPIFLLDILPHASLRSFIVKDVLTFASKRLASFRQACPHRKIFYRLKRSVAHNPLDPYHLIDSEYIRVFADISADTRNIAIATTGPDRSMDSQSEHMCIPLISLLGSKCLGRYSTYSNSVCQLVGLPIGCSNVLRLSIGDPALFPASIQFASTISVGYLVISVGEDVFSIATLVDPRSSYVRSVDTSCIQSALLSRDSLFRGDISICFSHEKPEHATELHHNNSLSTACGSGPPPEAVLVYSLSFNTHLRLASLSAEFLELDLVSSASSLASQPGMPSSQDSLRQFLPKKRIYFDSFWPGLDPSSTYLFRRLIRECDLLISDNPGDADIIVMSIFADGYQYIGRAQYLCKEFNKPIIFFSGEHDNVGLPGIGQINFSQFLFCISHYHINSPNYMWSPLVLALDGFDGFKRAAYLHSQNKLACKRPQAFCCYSNPNSVYRTRVAQLLDEKGYLYSCGGHVNNAGFLAPREELEYSELMSQFAAVLAFENSSFPGYFTEKCLNALKSGSRVFYWGDPYTTTCLKMPSVENLTGLSAENAARRIIAYLESSFEPLDNPFPSAIIADVKAAFDAGFYKLIAAIDGI